MTNEQNKNSNKNRILLLALFTILAGGGAWLAFSNYSKSEKIDELNNTVKEKEESINEQINQITALKDDLKDIEAQRDSLNLDNSDLKMRMEELDKLLAQAKNSSNSSKAEKLALQNQLAIIKKERDKLMAEIRNLQLKNDTLLANNDSLNHTKIRLADSVNQLKTKEQDYKQTIAIASILEADKFKMEALDSKGKAHEGDEFRARKLEKLKVTFTLKKNAVAKENTKTVYLRLIEPTGTALFDMSTGGGTTEIEGKTISYTAKKEIEYSRSGLPVSFIYQKPGEYQKGTHKVEIYCEGHQIGESSFLVK